MQEQQHHHGHQDHRIAQGVTNFHNGLRDERRGVVDDGIIETVRKARLELRHFVTDAASSFQGVGAGKLINGQRHGRLAVQGAGLIVRLGPQLNVGDVAEADQTATGVGLQNHVAELIDIG